MKICSVYTMVQFLRRWVTQLGRQAISEVSDITRPCSVANVGGEDCDYFPAECHAPGGELPHAVLSHRTTIVARGGAARAVGSPQRCGRLFPSSSWLRGRVLDMKFAVTSQGSASTSHDNPARVALRY